MKSRNKILAAVVSIYSITGPNTCVTYADNVGDNEKTKHFFIETREAKENWISATEKTITETKWNDWLKDQIESQLSWQSEIRDLPEWEAGWLHDYIDDETGKIKAWTPNQKKPIINDKNQRQIAGWVANNRFHNIEKILNAARLYKLTKDDRFLKWCEEQINTYAESYETLTLKKWNGNARLMNQSLDEAQIAIKLLEANRLLASEKKNRNHDKWGELLFIPIANNLKKHSFGVHNISIWQNIAIYLTGVDYSNNEFIQYSTIETRKIIKKGTSADFYWIEDSLSYQDYVVEALNELFIAASMRGTLATYQRELSIAKELLKSPLNLKFESNDSPSPGDTTPKRKIPNLNLWKKIHRTIYTRQGARMAQREINWDTLLDPIEIQDDLDFSKLPNISSGHYPGLKAVMIVNNNWQLFSKYGQNRKSHSHQDALSFELQYRGIWISSDPGTVAYGSDLHTNFYKTYVAHNVPIIDGIGQALWPTSGELEKFDSNGEYVTLKHKNYQENTTAKRNFNIKTKFVDTLELKKQKESHLGLIFNTNCEIIYKKELIYKTEVAPLPKNIGFTYWSSVIELKPGKSVKLKLDCDGSYFSTKITSGTDFRIVIGRTPPKTQKNYGIFIESKSMLKEATFITEIKPNKNQGSTKN